MKKIIWLMMLVPVVVFGVDFAGGDGTTPESAYIIETLEQLQAMRDGLGLHYKLGGDIDASATNPTHEDYDPAGQWNDGKGFEPIGKIDGIFTGSLNGSGHVISGLYINRPSTDYVGLLGFTSGANINSVGIVDCDVRGYLCVGAIIGRSANTTILSESFSSGRVNGDSYIGGIVGLLQSGALIRNAYTTASVTGRTAIGGITGRNFDGATVSNCYVVGVISATNMSGAITGMNTSPSIISNCFWDNNICGTATGIGVDDNNQDTHSTTTNNMKTQSVFTSATWDFVGETTNGEENHWIYVSGEYPKLSWEVNFPKGEGTEASPYQITNVDELQAMKYDLGGHYELANDIDAGVTNPSHPDFATGGFTAEGFEPIGSDYADLSTSFTGSLNGNGFCISDIFINRPTTGDVGLFGVVDGAEVESLAILGGSITGDKAGGIASYAVNSSISKSFTSCTVTAADIAGGITAGLNTSSISDCYVDGAVNGLNIQYIGGISGLIREGSSVSTSYVTGPVSIGSNSGGIVGDAISGSSVNNCFWNINSAYTYNSSLPGTGVVEADMKKKSTFTNWDFVDGAGDEIWVIDETDNYPRLAWSVKKLTYSTTIGSIDDSLQYVLTGKDGTPVTASAIGYTFDKWSDEKAANPRTDLEVTEDISASAIFTINKYKVSYSVGDNGTITAGTAEQTLDYNSNATVTVAPKAGYKFTGWEDDATLTEIRSDVVPANDTAFTATFAWIPVITDSLRDSTIQVVHQGTVITTTYPGELGTEDTVITTTVIDTTIDSLWHITDTLTDGVKTSSSLGKFISETRTETVVSTTPIIKKYDPSTAIKSVESVKRVNGSKLLFAPNPVPSTATEILFTTPSTLTGNWEVTIYDNLGNIIDFQSFNSDGGYTYSWDLTNHNGQRVAAGMYVAIISVENGSGAREMFKRVIGVKQ
jgi:uncharacterized repeat protein (TIGR02543 family)